MRRHAVVPLLAALAALAAPCGTEAAGPQRLVQAADIGADQAAAIARGTTGGRVLGVRRLDRDGRAVYEVKVLLDSGLVRTVRVDGSSGGVF